MGFLRPRGRVFLEIVGLAYGALMILLAVVEWVGHYSWRLAPSSLLMVAGLCFLGAIYLVLDEIRLNTRK